VGTVSVATFVISTIGVVGALVGLVYAGRQLNASQLSSKGSFLLELDQAFARHSDVHVRLRPTGSWAGLGNDSSKHHLATLLTSEEWAEVEAYMGLFERIEMLVDAGIIDVPLVNRLYGYRVSNIVGNTAIRQVKLIKLSDGWQDFLSLCARLEDDGREFNFPELKGLILSRTAPRRFERLHAALHFR
jgi:hypothetical protein